jgi:hypothetical protein
MLSGLGEILKAQNGTVDPEDKFKKEVEMTSKLFEGWKKVNPKPRTLTLNELAQMTKSVNKG